MLSGLDKFLPLIAVGVDAFIGDPRFRFHPVVLIGKLIVSLEKGLRRSQHAPFTQKLAGAVLVVSVLAIVYGITWLIMKVLQAWHPVAALAGGALLLSFAISPRSLAEAGQEIYGYLVTGDLAQARFKVGWIVGRDTDKLDEAEITRATVETISENIVDGVVSPLFYAAIGGVPLAFLYRAVNTLDSMVGYKNEKYRNFGMVAARTDDVFNYLPARLTGIFIIIAAWLLRFDAWGAAKTIWRDAAKHPSPNSGIAEAGAAGALGIRLGGLNYYGGIPSFRPYMGEAKSPLAPCHIKQTIRIMYLVTFLTVIFLLLVIW
ncbi:cobalamin biosynthesis protein CobD [Thermosinus carboxydivorans Nor1]|uniref:Cobalamin biosynthesis protein CobD n=1 Tax=Thermosinus carboxydivorans Nor1 TaxID=401526 RepID=A1HPW4_9FIRM|nr:adenosylcobinamide-phosphate synthase CbiB [Thermosinus carboxydivorans]EAX47816.1 cobalamin biosynthesis protein CobD [Thermosinus carboxydivorans Nor1]